jgi:hypothetical protein
MQTDHGDHAATFGRMGQGTIDRSGELLSGEQAGDGRRVSPMILRRRGGVHSVHSRIVAGKT